MEEARGRADVEEEGLLLHCMHVLWQFILRLHRLRGMMQQWSLLMSQQQEDKSIARWKHKLGRRKRRVQKPRVSQRKRKSINVLLLNGFDLYLETGLFLEQFELLHGMLVDKLRNPRRGGPGRETPTLMDSRSRLVLALNWLREGGPYRRLQRAFGLTRSFVSRELHHVIPLLYETLDELHLPAIWHQHPFEHVSGAIDCTSHFRNRVHPKQADYYRRDKHGFFLAAQVICSLDGVIYDVQFVLGHNNDQGAFHLTKTQQLLRQHDVHLLADGGYTDVMLVTPDDDRSQSWNKEQKGLRSIVEVVYAMVRHYRLAAEKVSHTPKFQGLALMCIYHLTNINLKQYPIRPHTVAFLPPIEE